MVAKPSGTRMPAPARLEIISPSDAFLPPAMATSPDPTSRSCTTSTDGLLISLIVHPNSNASGEMLDMGFAVRHEAVLQRPPEDRQTVLSSATMPPRIDAMARRHLRDPVRPDRTGGGAARRAPGRAGLPLPDRDRRSSRPRRAARPTTRDARCTPCWTAARSADPTPGPSTVVIDGEHSETPRLPCSATRQTDHNGPKAVDTAGSPLTRRSGWRRAVVISGDGACRVRARRGHTACCDRDQGPSYQLSAAPRMRLVSTRRLRMLIRYGEP